MKQRDCPSCAERHLLRGEDFDFIQFKSLRCETCDNRFWALYGPSETRYAAGPWIDARFECKSGVWTPRKITPEELRPHV